MTWFNCSACKKRFEAPFAYYNVTCAFCRKTTHVSPDQGDVGAEIRSNEKAAEKASLQRDLETAKFWQNERRQQLATFKARYIGNDPSVLQAKREKHYVDRVQGLVEDVEYYEQRAATLERKLASFEQVWEVIERASGKAQGDSRGVIASGKNKLYIGDRQFVVAHTESNEQKTRSRKLRILDSNSWTWGLNTSWVEGGVEAGARFKLKLNDADARKTFPADVVAWFNDNAGRTDGVPTPNENAALESEFLAMCREKGRGNLLWYDRGDEERPTWTALEIACLIRRGYRFQFGHSKSGSSKIELLPPHGA